MDFTGYIWGVWQLPSLVDLDWAMGPGAAILLLIALALDWLIGDPRWLPHPVRLLGALRDREGHGGARGRRGEGEAGALERWHGHSLLGGHVPRWWQMLARISLMLSGDMGWSLEEPSN